MQAMQAASSSPQEEPAPGDARPASEVPRGIGEINLLDMDEFVQGHHHDWFATLRAEAPLYFQDEPDGPGFYNVVTHADLVTVNRDTATYSSQLGGTLLNDPPPEFDTRGILMLDSDAPTHTRYRRLVNKGFTPRMIGLIEQHLTHRSELIVDRVIEKGECEFVTDLAAELPLQAIAEIMGVPQEERHLLFDWSNRMVGANDPEYNEATTEENNDAHNAAMELYAYSNQLAASRREDPRDDIVTKLINAEIDGDRLSELEFDMFMLLLAVAGNETTRNATAHGMNVLLAHPDQYTELVNDRSLLPNAIEEILRWASPVMNFRRTTTTDTVLQGFHLPAGSKVVMWHISANRDEAVFEDPFRFDIHRANAADHIAFGGGGAHYCLGANLARAELRIIFNEILDRMPDMTAAGPAEALRSNFIGGIKHLPVQFTPGPRKHAATSS